MIDDSNLPPGVSASDPHLTWDDETEAPDTMPAVENAMSEFEAHNVLIIPGMARAAINADRKSLTEQGYVIVKPVKMPTPDEPYRNDYLRGWAKCLVALRRLGLPIDVTE